MTVCGGGRTCDGARWSKGTDIEEMAGGTRVKNIGTWSVLVLYKRMCDGIFKDFLFPFLSLYRVTRGCKHGNIQTHIRKEKDELTRQNNLDTKLLQPQIPSPSHLVLSYILLFSLTHPPSSTAPENQQPYLLLCFTTKISKTYMRLKDHERNNI